MLDDKNQKRKLRRKLRSSSDNPSTLLVVASRPDDLALSALEDDAQLMACTVILGRFSRLQHVVEHALTVPVGPSGLGGDRCLTIASRARGRHRLYQLARQVRR